MIAELLFQMVFDLVFILAVGLYLRYCKGIRSLKEIVKSVGLIFRTPKKDIFATFSLFIAILGVSFLVSIIGMSILPNDSQNITSVILEITSQSWIFIIYLFIVRIAIEEIFFRGFLMKQLQEWFSGISPGTGAISNNFGVVVSSLLFGAMHFGYSSVIEIFGAFILGIILALAARRNGTIIPNIFAHMLYNALIVGFAVMAV